MCRHPVVDMAPKPLSGEHAVAVPVAVVDVSSQLLSGRYAPSLLRRVGYWLFRLPRLHRGGRLRSPSCKASAGGSSMAQECG